MSSLKKARHRIATPQAMVKCKGCGVTIIRYEYGFRGRMRYAKALQRPTIGMRCTQCNGSVVRM